MILTCTKPYPTSIALPVNDPFTPEAAALVGVGVGATSVAVFEFELLDVAEEFELFEVDELEELEELEVFVLLEVDVEFEVADFVAVEVDFFAVDFFVATAAADCVAVGEAVVTAAELFEAELDELDPDNEVAAEAPAIVESPLFPNCGGVTDKTAPRPPTVPPAISSTRFMPNLVFLTLTLEQNQ